MTLTGANFIGFNKCRAGESSFRALNPATSSYLDGEFVQATTIEFEQALALANTAFEQYRQTSTQQRATFLDAIADEIMAIGDLLLERCSAETGLPIARITGERGRTCAQLKLFAQLIRDGWYVDARIDTAQPDRKPLPKPDIRRMLVPIGPVAVFGASNFPLAFSTAGGDTASALAAGCPVVVKAHSSHPGTNELVCEAIIKAAKSTGMPEGIFSSLYLSHRDVIKLVEHPFIKAVGFTGSRAVGMRLYTAAVNRPNPIPVFAEMSAVNPVILLPDAVKNGAGKLANDLVASVTLGVGQFCTNPGLIVMIDDEHTEAFLTEFAQAISSALPGTMLNPNICKAFKNVTSEFDEAQQVNTIARSLTQAQSNRNEAQPVAYSIKAADFLSNQSFAEEMFGPATLVVLCKNEAEIHALLNSVEGQLTATIHATEAESDLLPTIIQIITQKAGRLIYGGFPTGVEVCNAMQHGGPYPSTTDGRTTSVGTAAIYRFIRPVAYQDFPDPLLPDALKRTNPLQLLRLLDNKWSTIAG